MIYYCYYTCTNNDVTSYWDITTSNRVMCLSALGDYDSCIEVVSASISEHGPLSDLLIIRARINYMFGNVCDNVSVVMVITDNP